MRWICDIGGMGPVVQAGTLRSICAVGLLYACSAMSYGRGGLPWVLHCCIIMCLPARLDK